MTLIDSKRLYDAVVDAFGVSIKDPIPVALGREAADGTYELLVPSADTDEPNAYYFHELDGMPPFQGYASNSGQTPLDEKYILYGMPIYIRPDPLIQNQWVIAGPISAFASQFTAGVDLEPPVPVYQAQIVSGLLTTTDPPSMRARVMGGPYTENGVFYYIDTQQTVDFSASPTDTSSTAIDVPTTNGEAIYVLVQMDVASGGTLSYKQGSAVSADAAFETIYAADAGTGTYMPQPDADRWRCGYIKLAYGMTAIQSQANIWAVQEILTHSGSGGTGTTPIDLGDTDLTVADNTQIVVGELQFGGTGSLVLEGTGTVYYTGSLPASALADLSDVSAAAQTANFVMAAGDGSTGGDYRGRALVAADIPNLSASKITSDTVAVARLPAMVGDSGSGGTAGLVPAPTTGDATKYLRGDATWQTVTSGATFVGCRVTQSTNTLITTSGGTGIISFDGTETYDTDAMHSTVTNPDRVSAPSDGYYHIIAQVEVDDSTATTSGLAEVWLETNGSGVKIARSIQWTEGSLSAFGVAVQCAAVLSLSSGDYVRVGVSKRSSDSANAWVFSNSTLTMYKAGE